MTISKSILKEAGLRPKFKFFKETKNTDGKAIKQPNGKIYKVKFLKDKEETMKDFTGKEIPAVTYLFEYNGEERTHTTPKFKKNGKDISYFVKNMAEFDYGDTLFLEGQRRGLNIFISTSATATTPVEEDLEDEEEVE
jgi:hypothetical protein